MKKILYPQEQNFWSLKRSDALPLQTNTESEVVVIGGGMARLTAAQAFAKKGKKVIVLEAYHCGAGASGKSSGFIEPNCEMSLSEFIERYGIEAGKTIWKLIQLYGVEHIRNNIKQYNLDCDYTEQDSLDVASSEKDVEGIVKEAEYLAQFGYKTNFITKEDLPSIIGSDYYIGAATGLPIAAMLGNYCADYIIDGADTLKDYFSPYRKFSVGGIVQTALGTKATFAISHLISQIKTKHV
jgi:hypothetical protein